MNSHRSNLVPVFALLLSLAAAAAATAAEPARGKVNINTASAEQLAFLPRVGPSVAQRIVEFRKENGEFQSAADLMLVRGIGDKTFELISPYVSISGETTLSSKVSSARKSAKAEPAGPKD